MHAMDFQDLPSIFQAGKIPSLNRRTGGLPSYVTEGALLYCEYGQGIIKNGDNLALWKNYGSADMTPYQDAAVNQPAVGINSVEFTSDKYLTVADNGNGIFSLQEFTIMMMVYIPETVSNFIELWSYDYTSHSLPYYVQSLQLNNDGSELSFKYNSGGNLTDLSAVLSSGDFTLGAWNFVVVRFNSGSRTSIRVNNAEKQARSTGGAIVYNDKAVLINKNPNTTTFDNGAFNMYAVGFYDHSFTDEEETLIFDYLKKKLELAG